MLDLNTSSARRLDVDSAVASRLVRSARLPREFSAWLADPTAPLRSAPRGVNRQVTDALAAIIAPVAAESPRWEQQQAESAPVWLGAVTTYLIARHPFQDTTYALQLVASGLLPLYRALATGKLREGIDASQQRLVESLVVLGLCEELGEDFNKLLEQRLGVHQAPVTVIRDEFNLDLVHIGLIVRRIVSSFEASTGDYSEDAQQMLWPPEGASELAIADWSRPEFLWQLADEMMATKSEMVLPRPWIDTPAPWSKINDHWNRLSHLLLASGGGADSGVVSATLAAATHAGPLRPATRATEADCRSAEASSDVALDIIADAVALELRMLSAKPDTAYAGDDLGRETEADEVPATGTDVEFDVEADFDSEKEQAAAPTSRAALPQFGQGMPKIMLAEIRSHNDPMFVNVIRQRLATCRAQERSLCLSHIVVAPEDKAQQNEVCSVRENGLTLWQHKLVHWLAEHSQLGEPYAFLTSHGELILCAMDLERNDMTSVIRQGLVEVLTGQSMDASSPGSLARVNVPARFHAGIACTSSPGASFTAGQLIEPAIRCLAAAQRHGKASIKSIEVF